MSAIAAILEVTVMENLGSQAMDVSVGASRLTTELAQAYPEAFSPYNDLHWELNKQHDRLGESDFTKAVQMFAATANSTDLPDVEIVMNPDNTAVQDVYIKKPELWGAITQSKHVYHQNYEVGGDGLNPVGLGDTAVARGSQPLSDERLESKARQFNSAFYEASGLQSDYDRVGNEVLAQSILEEVLDMPVQEGNALLDRITYLNQGERMADTSVPELSTKYGDTDGDGERDDLVDFKMTTERGRTVDFYDAKSQDMNYDDAVNALVSAFSDDDGEGSDSLKMVLEYVQDQAGEENFGKAVTDLDAMQDQVTSFVPDLEITYSNSGDVDQITMVDGNKVIYSQQ